MPKYLLEIEVQEIDVESQQFGIGWREHQLILDDDHIYMLREYIMLLERIEKTIKLLSSSSTNLREVYSN